MYDIGYILVHLGLTELYLSLRNSKSLYKREIIACPQQYLSPSSISQVLREVLADAVAYTAVAVSRSGRTVFTGTSSGTINAVKYPLPMQKERITYQAHCGPVTKVSLNVQQGIKRRNILRQ